MEKRMELNEFCNYLLNNSRGVNLINFYLKLEETDNVDYTDTEIRSSWKISFIVEGKNLGSSVFKIFKDDPAKEEINVLKSYTWGIKDFFKNKTNYNVFIKFEGNTAICKLVRLGQ